MKTSTKIKNDFIKTFELIVYYSIVFVAIWTFLFVLAKDLVQSQGRGGDADIFCLAGQAISIGNNPYLIENLGTTYSWNYLPIFANGFHYLCSRFNFQTTFIFFYFPLLLLGLNFWVKGESWLYGIILCASGLYSFGWVIITGNVSVLEFFLFSLSAYLFLQKKYELAFFILGLNASIKIVPILYFPVFLLFVKQANLRRKALFWTAAGFLLPFFVSAVFEKNLMPWYLKQLLGLIPDQHSAFDEFNTNYFTKPLFLSLVFNALGVDKIIKINFPIAMLGFVLGMGILYIVWLKLNLKTKIQSDENTEIFFGIMIIMATLLLPRLKPYSFLPALLLFYVASRNQNKWVQSIFLLLLSVFPNFLTYIYKYQIRIAAFDKMPVFINKVFLTMQIFNQTFFLFFAVILLIILIWGKDFNKKLPMR